MPLAKVTAEDGTSFEAELVELANPLFLATSERLAFEEPVTVAIGPARLQGMVSYVAATAPYQIAVRFVDDESYQAQLEQARAHLEDSGTTPQGILDALRAEFIGSADGPALRPSSDGIEAPD